MNICGYADCPGDDREAGTSCSKCAEEWARILAELDRLRAIEQRAEDVEGLARLLASQPSTFTVECLSGPSSMLKWGKTKFDARAVSAYLKESK